MYEWNKNAMTATVQKFLRHISLPIKTHLLYQKLLKGNQKKRSENITMT